MKHHWRKQLEPDGEGRPHLAGAQCEWCRISKPFDDMPADIRTMFHSREAGDLRVAWAWLHTQFPGECPGLSPAPAPVVVNNVGVNNSGVSAVNGDGLDGVSSQRQAWHDYHVVYGSRLDVLCTEVSTAMAEGWEPSGSMAVHDDNNHAHITLYYQPMVRRR